jgi:voltage-gated potassium channel
MNDIQMHDIQKNDTQDEQHNQSVEEVLSKAASDKAADEAPLFETTLNETAQNNEVLNDERRALLERLEDWLETPMLVLGFVWLALLILEFVGRLSAPLEALGTGIWIIFLLDFALRFSLAPYKLTYFKSNWLTVLALLVPALRVFRIVRVVRLLRVARAARGLRLFRLVSSLNRGMNALGRTMGRRGFGYVVALTFVVTLGGAAGMYAFENDGPGGFKSYGASLWWTAMLMTTLGSEHWPQSDEGRVLCFLLSLYAFAVFGYVTATLATFFVGRDAENEEAELASTRFIEELHREITTLREEIQALMQSHESKNGDV